VTTFKSPKLTVLSLAVASAIIAAPASAAPNNPPSYTPGANPTSSPCDGLVTFTGWAQNVTDGDGETSGLTFRMTGISNPDIFSQFPFVSWPSKTLTYRLKPGTPAGSMSTVTAVLIDTSGTGQGGSDTSEPQTWTINTSGCIDVDFDGIADDIDDNITIPVDSDGDGIVDPLDDDDDNDGILDIDEGDGLIDSDGDGIPDSLDTDSDNDGILDADEPGDSDNDGIPDSQEPMGDDVSTDTDGDGISDDLDLDDDNDGIPDALEGDGAIDTDGDGIPDSRDLDSDGDGVFDLVESGVDAAALDANGDGMIDGPTGANGLADALETSPDSGQLATAPSDSDGDGIPDAQDDGVLNDDSGDTTVDNQSGDGSNLIETGLKGGGGCTLSTAKTFDPVLMLAGLLAFLGLRRRKA